MNLSPIAAKQRALYAHEHPLMLARALRGRMPQLGTLGANSSVWSGPPTGEGAGQGAKTGATQGAALGTSIMPGIGTAIGTIVGAIGGAIAGSLNKKDPENANFDQAVAMWNQSRLSVLNIANKYLPLAGLFDLNIKTNIPIYKKYGRMGEQRFVTDMMTRVYQAGQSGQITATDTPQTIMVKVVQPWIDSWGFGPMADPHADMINLILMGMIADYVAGNEHSWLARGGQYPFSSLPAFSLPGGSAPTTAAQFAPTNAVAAAPISAIVTRTPPPATFSTPPGLPALPPAGSTTTAPPPSPPSSTTVAIPAGYTVAGPDAMLGTPVYQGLDGRFYSWNGATMTPFSGSVAVGGGLLSVQAGAPQAPPPTNTTSMSSPPLLLPAPTSLSSGAAAPPPAPVAAAGFTGAGLPPWVTWGALAAGAALLFATARPVPSRRKGPRS